MPEEIIKRIAFIGTQHQLNILNATLRQNGLRLDDIEIIITISDERLNIEKENHIPPQIKRVMDVLTIKKRMKAIMASLKSQINGKYIAYFCNDNNLLVQLMINDESCICSEMIEDGLGSYLPRVRPFYGINNLKSHLYHTILLLIFRSKYKYNPKYYFGQYMKASKYWALSERCFPLVNNVNLIQPQYYLDVISTNPSEVCGKFISMVDSHTLVYIESPVVEDNIIPQIKYFKYLNSKLSAICKDLSLQNVLIKTHPRSSNDCMEALKSYLSERNPNIKFEICFEKFNFEVALIELSKKEVTITSLLSSSIFYSTILFGNNHKVVYLDGHDLDVFLINEFQSLLKTTMPDVHFI